MKIIAGLGNPGPKYETTRHNVGWLALDRLIDSWKANGPKNDHQAEVYRTKVDGEDVLLVKPQTFMNLSGRSVAPILKFFKCQPSDLIVLHDELDIPPLALKIKTGGGNGGHNGLKSLDECLGTNAYHRIRLGIGHPRNFNLHMDTADFVLGQIPDNDLSRWDAVFGDVEKAAKMLLKGDILKAMTQFNRKSEGPND